MVDSLNLRSSLMLVTEQMTVHFGETNHTTCVLYFFFSTHNKNCYCNVLYFFFFVIRCRYGNCQSVWREEENISCQDIDVVKNKNLEAVTVEELQA